MTKRRRVDPTPEEELAAAIVNHSLGTRTVAVDDQSSDGMIDAWLAQPDEPDTVRRVGLEISSTTEGKNVAMWKAIGRQYDGTSTPGLSWAWNVEFRPGASIGGKRPKELAAFLKGLEQRKETCASLRPYEDGIRWNGGWPVAGRESEIMTLQRLGIMAVTQISTDPQLAGRVFASTLSHGVASPTAEHIGPYITEFLATPEGQNKVKKLFGAPEAHLFIWADPSHLDVGLALKHRFQPVGEPQVPEHIRSMWLASRFAPSAAYRWTREAGWTVLEIPDALHAVTAAAG